MSPTFSIIGKAKIGVLLLMVLICLKPSSAQAGTLQNDLSATLGIEIGDTEMDFLDAEETVEKGRLVSYLLEIENTGAESLQDLTLIMNTPANLIYVPGSLVEYSMDSGELSIPDEEGVSVLDAGYAIEVLSAGEKKQFSIVFQVRPDITEAEAFTLAWFSVTDTYGIVPVVSNQVENRIFGDPKPFLTVEPTYFPPAGEPVNGGFQITYSYWIKNNGGLKATAIDFTTFLPENTACISNCGLVRLSDLESGTSLYLDMVVRVSTSIAGVTAITNIGYNLSGTGVTATVNRDAVIHPVDANAVVTGSNATFSALIHQVPPIVLNSPSGAPRADLADRSETQYVLTYKGRNKPYTYPTRSSYSTSTYNTPCGSYTYPQQWGSYFYAYNSSGGGCENIGSCPISSTPVIFNIDTVLPDGSPKMVPTIDVKSYAHGNSTSAVNSYMQNGSTFLIPQVITESRAVENGSLGVVKTDLDFSYTEDYWTYQATGGTQYLCTHTYSCGEDSTCSTPYYRPLYAWTQTQSSSLSESTSAETGIIVYTSTAWLKTEKGHIGTNAMITGGVDTTANYVDLGTAEFANHLTPSSNYTPPGETNGQYMIFGNAGTGSFISESGGAYNITGTEFPFLQRGDVYDRPNHPRDFYEDMLSQEKFGKVIKNEIPDLVTGSLDLGEDTIWQNTGDIKIGRAGVNDTVTIKGGQARIFTDGDVYINANIIYEASSASSYQDVTVLRIDARNIYINGEVEDIEAMLLARGSFHSGVSKKQLRILGDVIAGQSHWEREPLSEEDTEDEFNKPSEYLIEDMRKYVVPAPGDTELPDNGSTWRQVNPSSGMFNDAF